MKMIKSLKINIDYIPVDENSTLYQLPDEVISGPDILAEIVRTTIGKIDEECFCAIPVNIRNMPLGVQIVHQGTFDGCPVDPRSVFRAGIVLGASGMVVSHNHPSGSIEPSEEDKDLTEKLSDAGKLLGIVLLDHIIVTDFAYYSFAEHGEINL